MEFKEPAVTSREVMTYRDTYYLHHRDAVVECALFRGLGCDDRPGYEQELDQVCRMLDKETPEAVAAHIEQWPSIEMGVTSLSLMPVDQAAGLIPEGIPINGLVWMGSRRQMFERIRCKLDEGFRCIKLKIGGIDFDDEMGLLAYIRSQFAPGDLELRLDANGSFTPANALQRLELLSQYEIHSLEQPIRAGQWEEMARICRLSPIPIALDEELIGVTRRGELLDAIRPSYVILKPTLVGFGGADKWIDEAKKRGIGWWATSALESNIGLCAIARWLAPKSVTMPQGLGTGELYTNNVAAPVTRRGSRIYLHE